MIQDVKVPDHGNIVFHQENFTEFDNFEYLTLFNSKPKVANINHEDQVIQNHGVNASSARNGLMPIIKAILPPVSKNVSKSLLAAHQC